MKLTHIRAVQALAALAAFGMVMGTSSGAAASFHPGSYVLKQKTVSVGPHSRGGATAKCPHDDVVLVGGAYWHADGQNGDPSLNAQLDSSAPTVNDTGWFAAGLNATKRTLEFTVTAQCLPASSVGKITTRSRDIDVDPGRSGVADLKCPSGDRGFAGGGAWHRPGHSPEANLAGSLTMSDGQTGIHGDHIERWSVAGRNTGSSLLKLKVVELCVPTAVFPAPMGGEGLGKAVDQGHATEQYFRCQSGARVVAGGAFWSYGSPDYDSAPETRATILDSSPTADGTGWYVAGLQSDPHASTLIFSMWFLCVAA